MRKSHPLDREVFLAVQQRSRTAHMPTDKMQPVNRHMKRRLKALGRDD